jgi:hypothetical protein
MKRPLVVMIHGINDHAGWQESVSRVLEPHCQCIRIRYREFHCCPYGIQLVFWFQAVWLLLTLGVLAIGGGWSGGILRALLVAAACWVFILEFDWDGFKPTLLGPILIAAAGLALAWWVVPTWQELTLILALCFELVWLEARVFYHRERNYSIYYHAVSLFWPWSLPVAAGAAWFWAWRQPDRAWLAWWTALAVLILWSLIEPHLRRVRALNKVHGDLGAQSLGGKRPNVIAHSMGTFLLGSLLRDVLTGSELRLGRVVLVGCVLPRNYGWSKLLHHKRSAVVEVWNEQGGQDLVVRSACALRMIGFGTAGRDGFLGTPAEVHKVNEALDGCLDCQRAVRPGRVHNVLLPGFNHPTAFVSAGHAFSLWLPYLWGIFAQEFDDFLRLCQDGDDALPASPGRFREVESEFTGRRWNWTRVPRGGRSLLRFVEEGLPFWKAQLPARGVALTPRQAAVTPAQVMQRLFGFLCPVVAAALRQLSPDGAALTPADQALLQQARLVLAAPGGPAALPSSEREVLLLFLHPPLALTLALVMTLLSF